MIVRWFFPTRTLHYSLIEDIAVERMVTGVRRRWTVVVITGAERVILATTRADSQAELAEMENISGALLLALKSFRETFLQTALSAAAERE
jgi:hypothetical protein